LIAKFEAASFKMGTLGGCDGRVVRVRRADVNEDEDGEDKVFAEK
jgi:hypothetical protein